MRTLPAALLLAVFFCSAGAQAQLRITPEQVCTYAESSFFDSQRYQDKRDFLSNKYQNQREVLARLRVSSLDTYKEWLLANDIDLPFDEREKVKAALKKNPATNEIFALLERQKKEEADFDAAQAKAKEAAEKNMRSEKCKKQ